MIAVRRIGGSSKLPAPGERATEAFGEESLADHVLRSGGRNALEPSERREAPFERETAWLAGMTLGRAIRRSAERFGAQPFLLDMGRATSFAEFDRQVDRLAGGLLRLGVRRGDHVAVWLTNSPEWVLAFSAIGRIGAVLVPVNTRYKAEEVAYILSQSDARALIMLPRMWGTDYVDMLNGLAPDLAGQQPGALALRAFPMLRAVVVDGDEAPSGALALSALLSAEPDEAALAAAIAAVTPDDRLLICYTSGTTGRPKGAMHSHRVLKQATKVGLAMRVEPGDRVLGHMPFYHVAGLFMALVPALTLGAGLVLTPHWEAGAALELIERERVTMFGGIPTHFYDLMGHPSLPERDISSLKAAWIGGSPVMRETFLQIMEKLGLEKILSSYGMTENTISTTFNRWDDPIELCCQNKAPILADGEVKIVDPDTLEALPAGRDGEIWCRGETVMLGYYRNPEATRETITEDGWLRTGDIGRFDDEGNLSITGRIKEMFKIGGTNAYPAEIEQHLAKLPEVKMSVVVGAPDERLGEVGFAWIQLQPGASLTAEAVIGHCKGRIADYKAPRHVRFLDEFPLTSTGKIQRMALAERARRELADG
jgi:fatty-acyl-CoA synthase